MLAASLPAASFDVVTMGDVIEHLVAPAAALARIRDLLTPEGLLWLALPDAGSRVARALGRRWWALIPTHLQYFTRHSIDMLLRRQGFEPLEIRTAPKPFTASYYLGRVHGYSPVAARALVSAARAARVADHLWALDLRDRMGIVARLA